MTEKVICIIGGSGFLGHYINASIHSPPSPETRVETITLGRKNLDWSNENSIYEYLRTKQISDIIYLAAHANPNDPQKEKFYIANSFNVECVLNAAARAGLTGKFIFTSATSVYGSCNETVFDESSQLAPLNHYGASKLLGETYVNWYQNVLNTTIIRPSNCIGVGQKEVYLVPKLIKYFSERTPLLELGNLNVSRDFIDVRDVADIFRNVIFLKKNTPRAVNASSGSSTSIRELIHLLSKITQHHPSIVSLPELHRENDITYQCCKNNIASSILKKKLIPLEKTLSWMIN